MLVLCVCASVSPEISGMGGCITTLFMPPWRALTDELHKLLFEPTQHVVWEKKASERFHQLLAQSRARPIALPVTLAGWILPSTRKPLEYFWMLLVKGHALHITGTIYSCYCFLYQWAIGTPLEQVTNFLTSMNEKTNPFMNGIQLV